jgi:hypothetical protein
MEEYRNRAHFKTSNDAPVPPNSARPTRRENASCPAVCARCPDDCLACAPLAPRRCCTECGWSGTPDDWWEHNCNYPHPDVKYSRELPTPRVAQLLIDLYDRITLHPVDPEHVYDGNGALVPINNFGVMDILGQPVDLTTANAITAELAKLAREYIDDVKTSENYKVSWAQHTLRACIRTQLAVAK